MTGFPVRGLTLVPMALLAIPVPAAAAVSQAPQDSVLLIGQVVEEEGGAPIPFAELTLLDRRGRVIGRSQSHDRGGFSFVARDRVGVSIRAERLGYQENETPFLWFDGHDFFQVELRLDRDAILLAPLEVIARSGGDGSSVLANFHHRRVRGFGFYFTREDIERTPANLVTDLLARVPGVRLVSTGPGNRRVIEMSRAASPRGCPAQVYVDGMHITRGGASAPIDAVVSIAAVQGLEVYRGLATVPAEFLSPEAECGVIAIWTRRDG